MTNARIRRTFSMTAPTYDYGTRIDSRGKITRRLLGPVTTTLEQQIANFSDRATTSATLGDIINPFDHLRHGIGNGGTETDTTENRQIDQVITDIGDLVIRQARLLEHIQIGFELNLCPLIQNSDPQFLGAQIDDSGCAPGNNSDLVSGSLQHLQAMSILDIEGFELISLLIINDAPIGHNPIDIKQQEFNGGEFIIHLGIHHTTPARSKSWRWIMPIGT